MGTGEIVGGAAGTLCGLLGAAEGESYHNTLTCICWTAYHPSSPIYLIGWIIAVGAVALGLVGFASHWLQKNEMWIRRRLPAKVSSLLWVLSLGFLLAGDQYWLGAAFGFAAAIALHPGWKERPKMRAESKRAIALGIVIPAAIFVTILGLTLARILRLPGIP